MRRLHHLAPALVAVAAASFAGPAGAAQQPASLRAAHEVMVLTKERLSLMDEVMAAKWFSRTPIQDPAQEKVVIETAVAEGRELGVAGSLTRGLFEAEIAAAKEVELGWGSEWLYLGAPPGLAAPDLGTLRTELSAISERIVAVLPRLQIPHPTYAGPSRFWEMAKKVLDVPHLDVPGRAGLVLALASF